MREGNSLSSFILGAFVFLGLAALGYIVGNAAITFKEYERTVTVKGLSEREYPADTVIWPIQFIRAGNDLQDLYREIDASTTRIVDFLQERGVGTDEISFSSPAIVDKSAQQYGNTGRAEYRYTASQTVTVYSNSVDRVKAVMSSLSELGKTGIVFTGNNFDSKPEYIFTGLNAAKPGMIEEATRKAREVALKFAADSQSKLGKIKRARQGQFSIAPRDKNNPHIKKVRVVSTVEYYLSD